MSKTELKALFTKYLEDQLSPEEFLRLYQIVSKEYDAEALDELLENALSNPAYAGSAGDFDPKAVFAQIQARIGEKGLQETSPRVIPLYRRRRVAVAAAILLLFSAGTAGTWWWMTHTTQPAIAQTKVLKEEENDVAPGHSGATLTLASGQQIVLDSTRNGSLASEGNSRIVKQDSGSLTYQKDAGAKTDKEVAYNILTTPRGRQYQLTLADGTKVWLNSASSLRYPTVFTGKERRVEMTGEVYFEVAHNAAMPFLVSTDRQEVRVLGTHFNINAYPDEPSVRTTLLEGSVRVGNRKDSIVIAPGQQAQIKNESLLVIKNADTEEAVAWKNGFFSFRRADIQTVKRQLSRWYDVEVQYQGAVNPEDAFSGEIDRNLTLSDVLKGLQLARIHYRIQENRKLVIIP